MTLMKREWHSQRSYIVMNDFNRITQIKFLTLGVLLTSLFGCQQAESVKPSESNSSYYGTTLPFASEAVYFLMTDRFVDGDPDNNYPEQGGDFPTYQRPLIGSDGRKAYVGYMGGDFKGILEYADYIQGMGFTAIWLTPIVDQPNEAFSGGEPITFGGAFKDGGKTGYHGYWGVNFYQVDEHLSSADLSFQQLTQSLKEKFQIKTILDVVSNHGSPAFSMPETRDRFGKIYDQNNQLIADHQNVLPENLDPKNPLHAFFNPQKDIAQLADFNQDNPQVMEYLVGAYLHWIEQGADAFRIDTIKHMPHSFWKTFTDRIRAIHPDFFMFAESYSFDAEFIGQHTLAKNGSIRVLDFPGREAMIKVFENKDSDYKELLNYLHLTQGPYANPYELMTFYDNHDMARMSTDEQGFIDAHNWLFSSRGIPVVYYGSEIGFMAGAKEHEGNRNYFGRENIEKAKQHPVKLALEKIAQARKNSIALQKGLQVNVEFSGDTAVFYRVYQHQGVNQTALVLLNKGDNKQQFTVSQFLQAGQWKNAFNDEAVDVQIGQSFTAEVDAHGVGVYLYDLPVNNEAMLSALNILMIEKVR